MSLRQVFRRSPVMIAMLGLAAFALLAVRFSPDWWVFARELGRARADMSGPAERAAVTRAFLGGHSARAYYVIQQVRDLGTEIDDARHKILRWRLLVPALGHFLDLPNWLVLGLAHLGCLLLVVALVTIPLHAAEDRPREPSGALCLGIAAGASAPFFSSMGMLGYYDSWLALALIGVAFARSRRVVLLACLLAPWVDERFVIGLPLALGVRWIRSTGQPAPTWAWLREQALAPLALAGAYALVRLGLGGSGGSQTVGQYMNQFVFGEKLTAADRLIGAWEGLRIGWVPVAAAVVVLWRAAGADGRRRALLLGAGVLLTALAGLYTALDLGRSMVLLVPVVPLGWILAGRIPWWGRFRAPIVLAAAALALPASHVVGKDRRPVDNMWATSLPLATALNDLGLTYAGGEGVPRNGTKAVRWYREAADLGIPEAQHNLGVMYANGQGVPKDSTEAARWYGKAAAQDFARAQYNLGMLYAAGDGVPRDGARAAHLLRRAADQGNSAAAYNLGVLYATADGVPGNPFEAAKWYRRAAELGNPAAPNNLGVMYAAGTGVPRDPVQACLWLLVGRARGSAEAGKNLRIIEDAMTPEQIAEAERRAGTWLRKPARE